MSELNKKVVEAVYDREVRAESSIWFDFGDINFLEDSDTKIRVEDMGVGSAHLAIEQSSNIAGVGIDLTPEQCRALAHTLYNAATVLEE